MLLASGAVWVPYYFVIASDFGAFGAIDGCEVIPLALAFTQLQPLLQQVQAAGV